MRYSCTRSNGVTISIPCDLIARDRSAYQDIAIINTQAFGRMLILDGVVNLADSHNDVIHESLYCPAVCGAIEQDHGARVLILGGGDFLGAKLALSYKEVLSVTLVELDPMVSNMVSQHIIDDLDFLKDPRLNITYSDATEWIESADLSAYDVIVLDMTDPTGISSSLYSMSFLERLKPWVNNGGVISTQCDSPATIGHDYYRIIKHYQEVFGVHLVNPYRIWIHPYFEMFGRIMVGSPSLEAAAYRYVRKTRHQWINERLMSAMFDYAHDIDYEREINVVKTGERVDAPSVAEWTIG